MYYIALVLKSSHPISDESSEAATDYNYCTYRYQGKMSSLLFSEVATDYNYI